MGSSASVYSDSYVAVGLDYSLEFETEPFAQGTCRMAFRGVYRGSGPKNGCTCVTKVFKNCGARSVVGNYYPDARCSVVAEGYAKTFNRLFQPARPLHFVQPVLARTRKLAYASLSSSEQSKLSIGDYIAVEDFIPGEYRKFNSNTGWSAPGAHTVASFSHFSYHHSRGQVLVCDIQGVRGSEGYTLTDPAIHSRRQEFGATDLGALGMARFFSRHRCTAVCRDWRHPVSTATPAAAEAAAAAAALPEGRQRAYRGQLSSDQRTVNSAFREREDLPAVDGVGGQLTMGGSNGNVGELDSDSSCTK